MLASAWAFRQQKGYVNSELTGTADCLTEGTSSLPRVDFLFSSEDSSQLLGHLSRCLALGIAVGSINCPFSPLGWAGPSAVISCSLLRGHVTLQLADTPSIPENCFCEDRRVSRIRTAVVLVTQEAEAGGSVEARNRH